MNRLGLLHPSTLTGKNNAELSALYTAFTEHTLRDLNGSTVTYRLYSTGAMVGPFGILLHTPAIGRAYLELSKSLHTLPGLRPRTREILALAVAAYERAPFQFYAHGRLAREQGGLSQNELDSLHAGLFSTSFSEEDRAAYGVARELCVASGPLSEEVWGGAVGVLGSQGALAAVHWVAFHRFVATVLRGFDAQVPVPRERVEDQVAMLGRAGAAA